MACRRRTRSHRRAVLDDPPDNATANFVKVVQRVPVKITWTTPPSVPMRPGLSAEVTVHVGS